jgi:DNA-binding response OmpR family regulator
MRILLVEDEAQVASFICRGLREQQYTVDHAPDGEEALFLAQTNEYDLVLLDWRLPKVSGIDVLRSLREDGVTVPILLLTAKDTLQDKVQGLDSGADDYLTKPFGFEELLARVRALLRRRGDLIPTVLQVGDLEMDSLRHTVTRAGQKVDLTIREYELLEYLMRNADRVVTRTMLAEHVWEHDFDPLSNVIDVHIARLRRKIEGDSAVKLLHTVRGKGYTLRTPEEGGARGQSDGEAGAPDGADANVTTIKPRVPPADPEDAAPRRTASDT